MSLSGVWLVETDESSQQTLTVTPVCTHSSFFLNQELVETEDMLQIKPASDPPTDQPPESPADVSDTPACTEHHEVSSLTRLH